MGHYSCGGVGAALTPPSKDANPISTADITIHEYISPIRRIYQTSERAEIASYREARTPLPTHSPEDHDYSWTTHNEDKALVRAARAFVEENVKAQVLRITASELMVEKFASESTDIYIHGFVYEVAAGQVYYLSVSVGPPGASLPHMRFLPVDPNAS